MCWRNILSGSECEHEGDGIAVWRLMGCPFSSDINNH